METNFYYIERKRQFYRGKNGKNHESQKNSPANQNIYGQK